MTGSARGLVYGVLVSVAIWAIAVVIYFAVTA